MDFLPVGNAFKILRLADGIFNVVDNAPDFVVADKSALQPPRLGGFRRGKSISPRPNNFSAPNESKIVRESMPEATEKAMRAGILALIKPVMTSTLGRWVAKIK